jgi:chloramphenicol 3-O-phosphotransferase
VIVLINGSFGVGKTTVAKLLREAFPGSVVYDPEWVGLALMRLPKWVKFKGSGSGDFQDMALWRKSAVAGIRLFSRFARGHVIVPMTFSRRDYFDEVTAGIRQLNLELRVFCLKASLQTIKKRLVERGTKSEEAGWIERRIIECAEAHRDAHFGEPVETEDRTALAVAEDIVQRLQQPGATTVA